MKYLMIIILTLNYTLLLNAGDINKIVKIDKTAGQKVYITSDNSDASKKLFEKLDKPISKDWNTSMNDVCKDISTELDIKIEIDKSANSEGAIELSVNKLSGTNVVKLVLSQKGCVGKVKEGVLYISLEENK